MRLFIPLIIMATSALALADSRMFPNPTPAPAAPEAPRSAAAVDAKRSYELKSRQLRDAYLKALSQADQDYITALAKAEDAALAGGISNKPESDRIDAARLAAIDVMKAHAVNDATIELTSSQLVGKTWWYIILNGSDRPRHMQFVADGTISEGRAGWEERWVLNGRELSLCDGQGNVTMKLDYQSCGAWTGTWVIDKGWPICLMPVAN